MTKRKSSSKWQVIYMIKLPDGKKYIGSDKNDEPHYMGSMDVPLLRKLYTRKQLNGYSWRKIILRRFRRNNPNINILTIENEFIRKYKTNNPKIGINQTLRSRISKRSKSRKSF